MACLRSSALIIAVLAVLGGASASAQQWPGIDSSLTGNGRLLAPAGRMTPLGAFPTGGALSPDGRFYWAVDAGRGPAFVRVISVASGEVTQTLPIPGGYVGIAFAPDGRRAYVSGQRGEGTQPEGVKGADGDVIHVFEVAASGRATELDPLALPDARDGQAARDQLPGASGVAAWPEGLAVTPDGKHLVVALGQADQIAVIELASGAAVLGEVERYPYGVAVDPRRPRAYVTNERDGSVSVVELPSGRAIGAIGVGGERGNAYAHPQGIVADPVRDRLYVAVTDRDLVAVIDTAKLAVERYVDVGRPETEIGVAPVSLSVSPDGQTLYVANAGEDAVVGVALEDRPANAAGARSRRVRRVRSVATIGRYRRAAARVKRTAAGRRRVAQLRRRLLNGALARACAGPSLAQDRVYARAVLRAYARRDRDRRRGVSRRSTSRRFSAAVRRARRRLPSVRACPRPGFIPGLKAFEVIGRLPTAAYTTDAEVTRDGRKLVWLAAKGLGTGPNTGAQKNIDRLLLGRAGVLDTPSDRELAAFTARADRQVVPSNFRGPPAGTPLVGPGGGPSNRIKYVFYVVRENRTYDQVFGSEPRGRGDPRLQLFDDNGVPGPTGGVTPNAHALARTFPLLDNVHANSEESTVGHKITAGGYVNDYTLRKVNAGRGRVGDPDIFPIGIPPNAFVFDQAVRQGIPFRVYGELGAGNQPFSDDGRPTYDEVFANTDSAYPTQVSGSCRPAGQDPGGIPNSVRCAADSGQVGATNGPAATLSRMRSFASSFQQQLSAGTVPRFNYLILFNDHTDGSTPGTYTPKAMVADNDLALGQLVELVSQSPIWAESAILVVEDDSQDGIDSVDAHRIPAFVISPWARRGAVVSTRFDHYSFLRTAEMIVGLRPLSLNDGLATPLYDAFISGSEQPDVEGTRFKAIQPQQPLEEINPPDAPNAALSRALPWDKVDVVPQRLADRILWQSVFGASSTPPPPGPNASPIERARATGAMQAFRAGRSVRAYLLGLLDDSEDEAREVATASLLSLATGLSVEEAEERLEAMEGEE